MIQFNIPGTGVHIITPNSSLPAINVPVTIDGFTEAGSSPNINGPDLPSNAVPDIQLDGVAAGKQTGLVLLRGSMVRGLAITGFLAQGSFCKPSGVRRSTGI
jgi:hypothetical protein